ncbi:hypothetical protein ACFL09_00095 [Planctomycetota bacterium]
MDVERYEGRSMVAAWQSEIEKAIDNVKRNKLDKWMRREWHKAAARERWSADRKAKWAERKGRRPRGAAPDRARMPDRSRVTQPKVWVKGRVPKGFLDWVERHWSHDNETRAVLSECCFEVWERGSQARVCLRSDSGYDRC